MYQTSRAQSIHLSTPKRALLINSGESLAALLINRQAEFSLKLRRTAID